MGSAAQGRKRARGDHAQRVVEVAAPGLGLLAQVFEVGRTRDAGLQDADLCVQGRLRDVQRFGHPSEVQVVGKGDEREQPLVVHRSTITPGDSE